MADNYFNGPLTPEEFQRQMADFMRQHLQNAGVNPAPKPEPDGPSATDENHSAAKGRF